LTLETDTIPDAELLVLMAGTVTEATMQMQGLTQARTMTVPGPAALVRVQQDTVRMRMPVVPVVLAAVTAATPGTKEQAAVVMGLVTVARALRPALELTARMVTRAAVMGLVGVVVPVMQAVKMMRMMRMMWPGLTKELRQGLEALAGRGVLRARAALVAQMGLTQKILLGLTVLAIQAQTMRKRKWMKMA